MEIIYASAVRRAMVSYVQDGHERLIDWLIVTPTAR